jgi:TetR/AcrR family transcriptional regulator, transcriptional repressor of aconitase
MSDPGPHDDQVDPLRERLLDAAARVFASKGYSGTKIKDIVQEAGLSSGAVYGRFQSKNDMLTEAVVSRSIRHAGARHVEDPRVADLIVRVTSENRGPLTDVEAMQLEAYVTARREPEVAKALDEARQHWRTRLQPLVDASLDDGTVAPDGDPDSVLYLLETVRLGLLLQRAAGVEPPDRDAWTELIRRIVRSLAEPGDTA